MTKIKELIDKYIIVQDSESDYNPPSYIWTDNTGELIRCRNCIYRNEISHECRVNGMRVGEDDYCSRGVRK